MISILRTYSGRRFSPPTSNEVKTRVTVLQSTRKGRCRHGDLSVAINIPAVEVETPNWTKFSDAHDVVIAKVCLDVLIATPKTSPRQCVADTPMETVVSVSVQDNTDAQAASEIPAMPGSSTDQTPVQLVGSAEQPSDWSQHNAHMEHWAQQWEDENSEPPQNPAVGESFHSPEGTFTRCPGCGLPSNTNDRVVSKNPGYCCNRCAETGAKKHGQLCTLHAPWSDGWEKWSDCGSYGDVQTVGSAEQPSDLDTRLLSVLRMPTQRTAGNQDQPRGSIPASRPDCVSLQS